MASLDIARITEIIAAVSAEEILPRYQALEDGAVRVKTSPGDLVTDADLQAEKQLTWRLPQELPGSVVVGEEAVYADPTVLDRLRGDQPVWVVDPVDGTANFAVGQPSFACVVALVIAGQTVAGWIYHPISGRTWIAEVGSGAWCDGQRLAVTGKGQELLRLTGSLGRRPSRIARANCAGILRHGSAAHDYAALSDGRMHFSVYRRLKPWDHAAGVLLHREAGGYGAMQDGSPYVPTLRKGTIILAPDRHLWERVAVLVQEEERLGMKSG